MKKVLLATALAAAALCAHASDAPNLEASALVHGNIVVNANGAVQSVIIDDASKMPGPVAELIRGTAMQWRFKPVLVDGQAVAAKARMSVRLVASQQTDDQFDVHIKGATFGTSDPDSTDEPRFASRLQPHYPQSALRERMSGTVYLALRIDRTGHVTDVVAEQVNLDSARPDDTLARWRNVLTTAAVTPARNWTFRIPTTGELAKQDHWTVHVPVNFNLRFAGEPVAKNFWDVYIPGPYTPAPWTVKPNVDSADAIADGGLQTEGGGLTLLTPINRS